MISKLKVDAGVHREVVELVLNEVAEAIRAGGEDLQIYTSGATNIFKSVSYTHLICPAGDCRVGNLFQPASGNRGKCRGGGCGQQAEGEDCSCYHCSKFHVSTS